MRSNIFAILLVCFFPLTVYPQKGEEKVKVSVTILPVAGFVENVGGERVEVMVMIPPGANPHTYEPAPEQLKRLSESRLYVKVGSGIEFELSWLDKLISLNPQMYICDASRGIELIYPDSAGSKCERCGRRADPHIWLSPLKAMKMVENIRDALIEVDGGGREYYSRNSEDYIERLRKLHKYIKKRLKDLKGETFMVFHPAWKYFAREYGLKEKAAESEGKSLTPAELISLITYAKKNGIDKIFVSPQFNRKSAEVIAGEVNARVVSIDPLAKDYIENLAEMADILAGDRK
ncbi:MAG: zinc ABC transporter substrate-binding protein [Candidatus Omnitrophica bacterium]|nr:zinc ABC transporter substrate-binding protein [Candidatus Omnitrophota bacterium]MBD3268807.1 zinc ABC transporter substrate-binding protein [Candidatus Omnitrophota bacterium]